MNIEKREWFSILAAILLMAVIISFIENELKISVFLSSLLISLIVVSISVFAKKFIAYSIDVEVRQSIWQFHRYWISTRAHFEKPVPIGLILGILLAFLSGGAIKFLAFLQFESKATSAKAVKKYGIPRYSEIMDWDDALIVFYSTLALLILSVAVSFSTLPFLENLAKYSLIYAISNLIPIGKLDGSRLFFGSRPLFFFTWVLAVIAGLTIAF